MRPNPWIPRALAATALALSGCTAVTDVDRFQAPLEDPSNKYRTLDFSLTKMDNHRSKYFELRLIDRNNKTQFLAICDPFEPEPIARFIAPNVIPKANAEEYRLDFFGDMNENRSFNFDVVLDAQGKFVAEGDHSWRILRLDRERDGLLKIVPNGVLVNFEHNYVFQNLAEPLPSDDTKASDAVIDLLKLDRFQNKRLEVRIFDTGEHPRTLGLFRIARVEAVGDMSRQIVLPKIIRESNENFTISVYVDANGNLDYDPPSRGGDLGWSFQAKSQADLTLRARFDPDETDSNVDVGPP